MPRAVAPSLADPPVADAPSMRTTALLAILITALIAVAGLMLWLTRELWRPGSSRPSGRDPLVGDELEERRRRIRAAA
jgi:hypothetical protein